MAFVLNTDKEKRDKQVRQQGQELGVQVPGTVSPTASAQRVVPETQKSSGRWTNLQKYLQANNGQGAQLADRISSNIQGTANQGVAALNTAKNEYTQKVSDLSPNRTGQPNSYSVQALNDIANKAINTREISPEDSAWFKQIRDKNAAINAGTDTAPKTLKDVQSYQPARAIIDEAKNKTNLTATEGGRETLVRDQFGRPSYNKGQSTLDQLLLQNDPGSKTSLEALRTRLLTSPQSLDAQEQQIASDALAERANVSAQTKAAAGQLDKIFLGTPTPTAAPVTAPQTPPATTPPVVTPPVGQQSPTVPPVTPSTPVQQPGVTAPVAQNQVTPPAQPVQQGVLSDYEKYLLARPEQLNASQKAAYDDAIKNVKAKLLKQYGTETPLGIPLEQLATSIVIAQSKLGGANLNNTMTQEDLDRIRALNKLAGRDPNQLGDSVFGNLDTNVFKDSVSANYDSAERLLKSQQERLVTEVGNSAKAVLDKNVATYNQVYKASSFPLGKNVQDLYVNDLNNHNLYTQYAKDLDGINDLRAKYGLKPVWITPDMQEKARATVLNSMAISLGGRGFFPGSSGMLGTGYNAYQYIVDRLNSNSDYGNRFRSMINSATGVQAMYELISNLKSNPLLGLPNATAYQIQGKNLPINTPKSL